MKAEDIPRSSKSSNDDDIEVGLRISDVKDDPPSTVSSLLGDFAMTTTAHGIPRVYSAKSVVEKLFWICAFCGCLGVFLFQGTKLLQDFMSYPYTTRTDIITESSLRFPAITVCNVNMMRRSRLVNTRFEDLIELDGTSTGATDDYSWWFSSEFYRDLADISMQSESITETPEDTGDEMSSLNGTETSTTGLSTTSSPSSSTPLSSNETEWSLSPSSSDQAMSVASSSSDLANIFSFVESGWLGGDFDFYDQNFVGVDGSNDWDAIVEQSRDPDFYDVKNLMNPTLEELRAYGHQPEDFILQCVFDRRACSYRNFRMFQHRDYGNCFTFNGGNLTENETDVLDTGKTGAQYGLHLTLFVEHPEYVGLLTSDSGVKVSIHPPTEQPFPEDDGITASTGQKTTIALRKVNITRLGGRYGEPCTANGANTNFTTDEFSYTKKACQKHCLQKTLLDLCDCITDVRIIDSNQCSALNSTQEKCQQLVEYLYERNTLGCECPISCEEISYRHSVSSALWPGERYEEHLATQLSSISQNAARILTDMESTRKNLVRLVVYYEQLNYELNLQVAVHTIESLFGDIGGILGLYIGMSFMSFGEIILLLVGISKISGLKLCRPPAASIAEETEETRKDYATPSAQTSASAPKAQNAHGSHQTVYRVMLVLVVVCFLVLTASLTVFTVLVAQGTIVINM
ncbi:epithelial sodium channel subunit alpha-like [Diadema antillarum]|uniref:epithelial sodium channel subunit alpha-like n=1 Tax=Diadema antillarum TaxID=105358 RepID=UPI003A861D24